MSDTPRVLVLDDGELDDVTSLLEDLGFDVERVQGTINASRHATHHWSPVFCSPSPSFAHRGAASPDLASRARASTPALP